MFRWLVLSRILVPSMKALARPHINASSPNTAILLLSLLGPNVSNMQHPQIYVSDVFQSSLLTPGRLKPCYFARWGCRLAIFVMNVVMNVAML